MRSGSVSQPGHACIDSIRPGRGAAASFGAAAAPDRVLACGGTAAFAVTEGCTLGGFFGATGWIGTVATGSTGWMGTVGTGSATVGVATGRG